MEMNSMELKDLRDQIDAIDDELVHMFAKRMALSAQVADYTLYNPIRKEWFNDKRNCGGFNIKVGFDF